jgi:hypothetical protein
LNYLPGLALNCDTPNLSLPSSLDYMSEPLVPSHVLHLTWLTFEERKRMENNWDAWLWEWLFKTLLTLYGFLPKETSDANFVSQADFSTGMPLYFLG